MPCCVNLQPSGEFLMEDFYYAGGLPAVMRELGAAAAPRRADRQRHNDLARTCRTRRCWNREVIRTLRRAVQAEHAGIAVLQGNLAPDGAVIKPSAATPAADDSIAAARWCSRRIEEFKARIDDAGAGYRRELRHGAEGLRAEGLSRHGRGRQHAAAAESCCSRASPTWCGSPTRG